LLVSSHERADARRDGGPVTGPPNSGEPSVLMVRIALTVPLTPAARAKCGYAGLSWPIRWAKASWGEIWIGAGPGEGVAVGEGDWAARSWENTNKSGTKSRMGQR
jgi:hypothetical protein